MQRQIVLSLVLALWAPFAAAQPLRVTATVPDLADLAATVGGDAVVATSLAKGPQDPHFVEARPSFVRALHDADLLIVVGLELETGWLPVLLQGARNPRVAPGQPGHLDASTAIAPLDVPRAPVDRSMGDVHPFGNPHYLTDPVNGVRVAEAIRARLTALRPADAAGFQSRYDAFEAQMVASLVGAELAAERPARDVLAAIEREAVAALASQAGVPLEGWLGAIAAGAPRKAVEDHRAWTYFARRFGVELVAALEPLPGIAPTTRHLRAVIEQMRAEDVGLIFATAYFSPAHATFVARETGARVVPLAHQVGSRPGTDHYRETVDSNVRALLGDP
ncbi:MAG: metal ABC transporter substrate-binding protein [Myxococcota bacterium]|jgi:ABC-type Zn uptake system ZnuABC Zn-binding protein ZnuA|nr:metal ABC transporter substrate-binding protein [Myxococcota bacterium]